MRVEPAAGGGAVVFRTKCLCVCFACVWRIPSSLPHVSLESGEAGWRDDNRVGWPGPGSIPPFKT